MLSIQGWYLAISGSTLYFVMNGFFRTNGVLFPAIMSQEKLDRGTASWPLNLPGIAIVFMSPATGFLSNRFSPVCITAVGTMVFCLGILPCYFSTNIYILSIFFGLIRGCGTAMVITTISSSIATAFNRNRSTAMGIVTAGTSFAGLVLPLLTQYFLDNFGLKGTFLLLTGIALHALIGSVGLTSHKRVQNFEFRTISAPKNNIPTEERSITTSQESNRSYGSIVSPKASESRKHENSLNSKKQSNDSLEKNVDYDINESTPSEESKPDLEVTTATNRKNHTEVCTDTECTSTIKPTTNPDQKKSFNKLTITKMFTTRGFYFICFTQMFIVYLGASFAQVIVDYMADKGIGSSASVFMITITAIGEITGKLCFGWITDRKYLANSTLISVSMTLGVIMAVICTFTNVYWLLMTCSFILGVSQGSALSVNLVQVSDYFIRPEVPLAMSFIRGINGLATVSRAPVIGFFRDELGSYDNLFRILGAFNLFLALLWTIERCFERRKNGEYQTLK